MFDPRGGGEPIAFGVNRNSLGNNADRDPLSQVSPLNSTCVRVDLVAAKVIDAEMDDEPEPSLAVPPGDVLG